MTDIFIDTNIIIYYQDTSSPFCPIATQILESLNSPDKNGIITPWVINEIHYLYLRSKGYKEAKQVVNKLLKAPGLRLVDIPLDSTAINTVTTLSEKYHLKTFDAFHAYYCKKLKIKHIASFDQDFKPVPWLKYYKAS